MSENETESPTWRKASRSVGQGACVELAPVRAVDGAVSWLVRDSKNPHGPRLAVSREAVARLVTALRGAG